MKFKVQVHVCTYRIPAYAQACDRLHFYSILVCGFTRFRDLKVLGCSKYVTCIHIFLSPVSGE